MDPVGVIKRVFGSVCHRLGVFGVSESGFGGNQGKVLISLVRCAFPLGDSQRNVNGGRKKPMTIPEGVIAPPPLPLFMNTIKAFSSLNSIFLHKKKVFGCFFEKKNYVLRDCIVVGPSY